MVIPEFNQQVIANVPNLFCLGNFFCLKPVSDVIGGVCAERTANGIYVWKFYYPLFNRANELDLTLGQRLNKDDGYIESRGKTESSLGVEFANRIRPLVREVQDCSNYDSLIAFIEKNPRLIRNAVSYTHLTLPTN